MEGRKGYLSVLFYENLQNTIIKDKIIRKYKNKN